MNKTVFFFFAFILVLLPCYNSFSWGFFSHKKINEHAIYRLPREMLGFYKKNMATIVENSVAPDKRRYLDPSEGARHYIDIDIYGDSAIYKMPRNWYDACEIYTEDTLRKYGIVPWHILLLKHQLVKAFTENDLKSIIRISSDIGHYIADSNVPLHTTVNYNGQLTDQKGIHGLWESRIPELKFETYNLYTGPAKYLDNPNSAIWKGISQAHYALDSVLKFEKKLSNEFSEDRKYSIEKKGNANIKVYSKEYTLRYDQMLDGMVERQMKNSIKMVADIWYTSWVDAGQPDLPLISIEEENLPKTDSLSKSPRD